MQNPTKETSAYILAFVNRNNRCSTIFVLPERMAALLADEPKSKADENRLQFAGRNWSEARHAGMSSC